MWNKLFNLKKVKPGKVHFPGFGDVDFKNEKQDVDRLFEISKKHPEYLELTPEGKKHFKVKEDKPSAEEKS